MEILLPSRSYGRERALGMRLKCRCPQIHLLFASLTRHETNQSPCCESEPLLLFAENSNPSLKCSIQEVIFPEAFNGITPLQALAISCTENLPPSGLGNSLTVTNLPSSYTPRILLKLFQARYPSAYRATIPPITMEGRKVSCMFSQERN